MCTCVYVFMYVHNICMYIVFDVEIGCTYKYYCSVIVQVYCIYIQVLLYCKRVDILYIHICIRVCAKCYQVVEILLRGDAFKSIFSMDV